MYYSIRIALPSMEAPVMIECKGIKTVTDSLNEVLIKYHHEKVSHQDMSRIMCQSNDLSKRLKILQSHLIIDKKRCKTIRIDKSDEDVYIHVVIDKQQVQKTKIDMLQTQSLTVSLSS